MSKGKKLLEEGFHTPVHPIENYTCYLATDWSLLVLGPWNYLLIQNPVFLLSDFCCMCFTVAQSKLPGFKSPVHSAQLPVCGKTLNLYDQGAQGTRRIASSAWQVVSHEVLVFSSLSQPLGQWANQTEASQACHDENCNRK